ncbi:KH domain [Phytophthora infestans]|uniref:Branchpoint-bridging protein n=1 Tax=Phytophthora infestans TaxID=4787 RepID=A0A833T758_PHYIN|nr:KH domain [Phytophthora infestans]KAF4145338.1 KH domain [Phytophthora infestans]
MADDDGAGFAAFMETVGGDKPKQAVDNPKDEYHYEEEQEKEAMMKNYHHPMKQWFRQRPQLEAKYGAFPLFWQELKTWEPYREVRKAYIKFTEHGGDVESTEKKENVVGMDKQEKRGDTTTEPAEEQPKKRRKSRWGEPVESAADGSGEKKRKKSRWAPASGASSGMTGLFNEKQQQSVILRAELETINQKLKTVVMDAALIEKDPSRSPSPPPQYDSNGKRTNTREVRMKAALEKRRRETIEELVKINPLFRPPADYARQKLNRRIYIPIHEFPSYNFIGLIIGPRGNTQKRMERETNCKIAIRGKGSVKEGSKGKKMNADENDDLHVLITGDREEDLDKAAKEVQSLLVPVDDTRNAHKQKQLRELALINGTLRDDDYCHICGEKGHRQWECPNRDAQRTFKAVNVKCAICGDSSHPTRDCTQKKKSAEESAAIDKEYQQFMQQLGEAPATSTATNGKAPGEVNAGAAAPWLQPAKMVAQPWMQQSVGAPGTAGAPGVQAPPGTTALGSTPATAFPPPVAPPGGYDYQEQGQDWGQQGWNGGYNSYYGSWDQSGQAADYQGYGQYPPAGAAGAGAPGANGTDQYQYPPYGNPPQ